MRRVSWVLVSLFTVACVETVPTLEGEPSAPGVQVLPPPGPTCAQRCGLALELCVPFDATACDTGCDDARNACLEAAGFDCLAARRCYREPPSRPFDTSTHGIEVKALAGPVTLPTGEGDWRFEAEWTGRDSYLFLFLGPQTSSLFAGPLNPLLDASPRNVVYVFGWQTNEAAYLAAKARWQQQLNARTDQGYWSTRVVFIDQRIDLTTGWVADMLKARAATPPKYLGNGLSAFGIDRFQRIREVGMLGRLTGGGIASDLSLLQQEARAFNLEFDREARLAAQQATVVNLATELTAHDRLDFDVTLPDPSAFDTLEVDLALDCPRHMNAECGAWDYLSHLRLCAPSTDADGGATWTCDREVARWITTYWREGRWVTDISAQLATLSAGPQHLRWVANGQWDPRRTDYIVSLSLRYSNQQRGMRPVSATPLWTGGNWNATYDASKALLTVPIPADAKKVELVTLTTGHGGVAGTNCAEFCNHQHLFTINGTERRQAFPEVQTNDGCQNRVDQGVVPNQHGTWYYGRGGWCPGQDVAPWVVDVTSLVTKGQDATLTYRTQLNGAPVTSGQGNIVLSSWLVVWK